jgi:DNA-binding beta-propeller fold protein YncE
MGRRASSPNRWSAVACIAVLAVLGAGVLVAPSAASPPPEVAHAVAAGETGELTPQGCVKATGTGATCAAENAGLAGAHAVAMSPDGKSLYATGLDDDAVSIFGRDPATGALTPQGCVTDFDSFPGSACAAFQEGMAEPFGVAVSPDGLDVYVASLNDHAVAHLERDPGTGALTPAGCIGDTGDFAGCGGATQGGLLRSRNLVVATDGTGVYVASGDTNEGAVVRLTRNPTTGVLSPGSCVMITGGSAGCAATQDNMDDVYDIAQSADGVSLHVVSRDSGAVFSFGTPNFGSLGCFYDSDVTAVPGCTATQGLAGARGVAVSPDGASAYVVSGANSALVRFDRSATGMLSPVGCLGDVGTTACPATVQGLGLGVDVAVSPDSRSVYAVGQDAAVVRFDRDPATRALTAKGCISQAPDGTGCATAVEGLFEPRSVVVSPDGTSVYVVSYGRQSVTRFDRAGAATPLPPNEVKVRTKKATCQGACRIVKLKIVTPPATGGRLVVCHLLPSAKFCPGWKGRVSLRAGGPKLVKTKSVQVSGGKVVLKLKTTKKARALLLEKGRLKLKLRIDFEPTGGTRSTMRHKVKVTHT